MSRGIDATDATANVNRRVRHLVEVEGKAWVNHRGERIEGWFLHSQHANPNFALQQCDVLRSTGIVARVRRAVL